MDALPPGFHPMHELPAPGKARLFLYEIPGEGRKVSEARSMTATVPNKDAPGGWTAETFYPIAWRYR